MVARPPRGEPCSMESTRSNSSIAARAGRWSARNKKKAFFGWIAFVAIAYLIGGAVGIDKIDDSDKGAGDSAKAERIYQDAFPKEPASESVLIQSKKAGDAASLEAVTKDVATTIQRAGGVKMQQTDTSK